MEENDWNVIDPTAEEVHATFRLSHETLVPQDISNALELDPSHSHRKGDRNLGKEGREYTPYKIGVWTFSSKGKLASTDLNEHINWVLTKLDKKKEIIKEYQDNGFQSDVFCFWSAKCDNTCPGLSKESVKLLANLDLEIWIDVYL